MEGPMEGLRDLVQGSRRAPGQARCGGLGWGGVCGRRARCPRIPRPAGRFGERPARTRMCVRAGATVRKHPLSAV